jgi:hypothetical protein
MLVYVHQKSAVFLCCDVVDSYLLDKYLSFTAV